MQEYSRYLYTYTDTLAVKDKTRETDSNILDENDCC
jgi:hypothetical protein